ncbi:MAG TPA: glycogen debranching N-terminal domain-containing protein [Stellaceae bacterium]|jgi:glycogen debranching enzyme|nr:glycogen debranching N-terminal domain-containing protein [Stellaceae bacterium]
MPVDSAPLAELENVSPFYIPSSTAMRPERRVLKTGDSLAILDAFGNIEATTAAEGFFFEDTRYLSRLVLTINGQSPLLLSSTVTEDNATLEVDLANPDQLERGHVVLSRDTVHLLRSAAVGTRSFFETVELRNFGHAAATLSIELGFDADFVDMFEVRGTTRLRRGTRLPDDLRLDGTTLGYRGLDNIDRRINVTFDPRPHSIRGRQARWQVELPPGGRTTLNFTFRADDGHAAPAQSRAEALTHGEKRLRMRQQRTADIYTTNESFNTWLSHSRANLDLLITETPHGLYPYAGVPWFSTAFGRDGIITALECLWLDPTLAAGTLRFLAAKQARAIDPAADAEPGKILHETRKGEMAALKEVPFGCYYGSVDATPLFVVLAAAYYARTGDRALIEHLWPHIEAALRWMEEYGDRDRDGFLEYGRASQDGLVNQGWKDSGDSIFHADGSLAQGPIALIEVQAYAYAAYHGAAALAMKLGKPEQADALGVKADILAKQVERVFWLDELNSYALALDGKKAPCRVRASNAGHVLFAGLASPARAQRVAQTLMTPEFFSDWGIRTVADGEARYNPMSYHNGSIWPHDNGMIALGLGRYGLKQPLLKVMSGLFDAMLFSETKGVPELFCGFARRKGMGPTSYPVACMPQAWSSAAIFAMLGAALGITFDAEAGRILLVRPTLPDWMDELRLTNLRLRDSSADIVLRRSDGAAALYVTRRDGPIEIVLVA